MSEIVKFLRIDRSGDGPTESDSGREPGSSALHQCTGPSNRAGRAGRRSRSAKQFSPLALNPGVECASELILRQSLALRDVLKDGPMMKNRSKQAKDSDLAWCDLLVCLAISNARNPSSVFRKPSAHL